MKVIATAVKSSESHTTAAIETAAELIDVSKSIDERTILRNITLAISAGQFVAVLGANGTGKSTLLKVISTLIGPSSGQLKLFGKAATATSADLRRRIALIGHQSMLYRDLSARENLEFFAKLYGVSNPAARARQMLNVIGLCDRASDPIRTFSRGMVQRVAIARALVHNPDLLLADEPFDGLDAPSIEALENLFGQLHEAGKTIVMVNHDIPQSLKIAEHAIILRGGRVVVNQPTHRLYEREVLSEVRS